MAIRADELKAKGDEGEALVYMHLMAHPVTGDPRWFRHFRNVRMRLNEFDLRMLGVNATVEQYEARFNTHGDLDLISIGPTGIWLNDVKNWDSTIGPGPVWQERMDYLNQGLTNQRDFLRVKLAPVLHEFGIDVQTGVIMAGRQQPFDGVGEFPMRSIEDAMDTMIHGECVIAPGDVRDVYEFAQTAFELASA